jgi:signal transduction histidine kinase
MLVVEGRDITAQQRSRQHMQVVHRVMRHNMRNDLNKVRAWTQMLVEEDDPEQRAEQFDRLKPTLAKWERMTDTLQEIRQALDSQRELESDVPATAVVSETVSESQEAHPGATIDARLPENSTARVSALLGRALEELIDNAVRASEEGEAHVEVTLSRPDEGWVAIDIADDGPGLPEMEAEVLETGEETQLVHGGGLGLWMVRTLVTGNGGDIEVDVTAEGTRIRLLLPAT